MRLPPTPFSLPPSLSFFSSGFEIGSGFRPRKAYTYPRLDLEVSKKTNHLLKAPFCVHPKTGRVCVPIDPAAADEFDPRKVPTVAQLLSELDELGPAAGMEQTSLAEHVRGFREGFLEPLAAALRAGAAGKAREAAAAPTLAW